MTTQVPTELPSDEVAGDAPTVLASDVPTEAKSDALSEPRTLVRVYEFAGRGTDRRFMMGKSRMWTPAS